VTSDILIQQYRGGDVAELVDALGALVDARLRDAVESIEGSLDPSVGGVWLDHIGQRLGLPRPLVLAVAFFGFDDAGVGWGQAPYVSPATRHASRVGVADAIYRMLLAARGRYILGGADGETLTAVLDILYTDFRIDDPGTLDVTLHIPTDVDPTLQAAVTASMDEILPRAAGVAYTVMADL